MWAFEYSGAVNFAASTHIYAQKMGEIFGLRAGGCPRDERGLQDAALHLKSIWREMSEGFGRESRDAIHFFFLIKKVP